MKTATEARRVNGGPFDRLPKAYLGLCQRHLPRPLHDKTEYEAARWAIEPLVGFEDRLNADQLDYL